MERKTATLLFYEKSLFERITKRNRPSSIIVVTDKDDKVNSYNKKWKLAGRALIEGDLEKVAQKLSETFGNKQLSGYSEINLYEIAVSNKNKDKLTQEFRRYFYN